MSAIATATDQEVFPWRFTFHISHSAKAIEVNDGFMGSQQQAYDHADQLYYDMLDHDETLDIELITCWMIKSCEL